MFGFVAKHCGVWQLNWTRDALGRVVEWLLRATVAVAEGNSGEGQVPSGLPNSRSAWLCVQNR